MVTLDGLLLGVTDKDALAEGRSDILVPPESIGWILDIGSGDGMWAKEAHRFAPEASIYRYDWRAQAIQAGASPLYPSKSKEIYVPRTMWTLSQAPVIPSNIVIEVEIIRGSTVDELIKELGANPSSSIIRVAGVSARVAVTILQYMPDVLQVLFHVTGRQGDPECEALSAILDARYKTRIVLPDKETFYVTAMP